MDGPAPRAEAGPDRLPSLKPSVRPGPRFTLRTTIGGERVLELPYGEDLPRIC